MLEAPVDSLSEDDFDFAFAADNDDLTCTVRRECVRTPKINREQKFVALPILLRPTATGSSSACSSQTAIAATAPPGVAELCMKNSNE